MTYLDHLQGEQRARKQRRRHKNSGSVESNTSLQESSQPVLVDGSKGQQTNINRKRRRNNHVPIPQDAEVISIDDDDEVNDKSKRVREIKDTPKPHPDTIRKEVMEQLESDDYFVILGLVRTATESDVKKAYRKLAIQWHPDKNRNHPKAEEYFKKIGEAYAILSDPEKRSHYEVYGKEEHGNVSPEYERYNYDPFNYGHEFTARHARDVFEAFFGGMDPFEEMFGRSHRRHSGDPFKDHPMMGFGGFGGFGMPMMMGFGSRSGRSGGGSSMFMESMMNDFGSFGSSSSSNFSQSISASSYTDPNGQTVTRKTTTNVLADGTCETTTEEFRNGRLVNQSSNRLAGAGRMQLDTSAYETSSKPSSSSMRRSHSRRY